MFHRVKGGEARVDAEGPRVVLWAGPRSHLYDQAGERMAGRRSRAAAEAPEAPGERGGQVKSATA